MEKKLQIGDTVMLSILHTYEENKKEVCKQPLNLTKKIIDFLVTFDPGLKTLLGVDFLFLQNSVNETLKKFLFLLFVERVFYRLSPIILVLKFDRLNRFSLQELNRFVELLKTNGQGFLYYIRVKSAYEYSVVFTFTEPLNDVVSLNDKYNHCVSFYEKYWPCGAIECLVVENLLHFLLKDIANFFTDVHLEEIVNLRLLVQLTAFFESNIMSDSVVKVSPAVRAYEMFLENKASGCSYDVKYYSEQLQKYGYGFYVTLANAIVREKFKEFQGFFRQFDKENLSSGAQSSSKLFKFCNHLKIKDKLIWHKSNVSILRALFSFLVYMFLNLSNNKINSGVNLYYTVAYHSVDFLGLLNYIGTAYNIQILKLEGLDRFRLERDDPIKDFYEFGVQLFYKMIVLLSNYVEIRYHEDENGVRVEDQFAILFKEDFIYKQKDDDRFALLRMNFGYRNLMVVPPIDWTYSPSGIVRGGGYLVNKYELVRPYPHNFLRLSEFYVNIINKLQSQALVIATDYFNFINDNLDCFFSKEDLKVKKQKRVLLAQEKQKNWNDMIVKVKQQALQDNQLSVDAFKELGAKGLVALYYKGNKDDVDKGARYDEINAELADLNSELAEYETFVRVRDYLMDYTDIKSYRLRKKKSSGENEFPKPKINAVYFPYTYDFRGRIYPHTTELNYMSSSFGKSLFKSYVYEFFNFEIFKVYAYKCFKNVKAQNEMVRNLYHVELHDRLLNFRKDLSLFNEASNRFGLLSCALELEKYTKYVKEHGNDLNYRSNFLIGVDAHCSGAQIMALLLKDLTALRALNLNVERSEDAVNDYYLSVIKDYIRFLADGTQFGDLGGVLYNEFTYARDLLFNNRVLIHLFDKGNEHELRKFFKNSIMTFAYGVTISTYTDRIKTTYNTYVRQVMKEPELLREKNYSFNGVYMFFKSFYTYYHRNNLIGQLYAQLQSLVGNVISKDGITFSLPTGGQVRQKYVLFKSVQKKFRNEIFKTLVSELDRLDLSFKIRLPKSISISFIDPDNINTSKQRTAFPANFVHSLDSSILLFVLNELFLLNRFVLPIHDCFMVHTSNYYSLVSIYNQQLILLFLEEYDVIDNLIESLIKTETRDKKLFLDIYAKLKELRSTCTPEDLEQLKRNISMSLYSLAISE